MNDEERAVIKKMFFAFVEANKDAIDLLNKARLAGIDAAVRTDENGKMHVVIPEGSNT